MRVCTINLGGKADWRVRRALKRRARDADVITVQEAGDRAKVLGEVCVALGWTLLREDGDGRGKVATLLAPAAAADLDGWEYVPCTPRTFVGTEGAGPERISPKHVLAADLGDVTVGTTHLVPSVQRPPFPGRTKRRELYRQHIAAIVEWAAGVPTPIVLTGDFNATPDYPQLDPLREGGFRCHAVPSFGARAIDHIWVRGCTADAVEALPFPSDHRMVAATVTLPEVPAMSRTPKTDAFVAALRRRGVEVLLPRDWGSTHLDVYTRRLDTHHHGLLPSRPVDTLWNHITVTRDDGRLIGEFKADCREVERIGFERFGSGVSYNILVDANAGRPRIALGQFLEAKGTHTVNDKGTAGFSRDQNLVALAVAWVGMPGNQINEHGFEAMVQVRAALIEVDALTDHYDDVPHSLVAFKECPTGELRDELPELKRRALADVHPIVVTRRWDQIWENANSIAQDAPDGTTRDEDATTIRRLAARHSTKH